MWKRFWNRSLSRVADEGSQDEDEFQSRRSLSTVSENHNSFTTNPFEDFDSLESGFARGDITEKCLTPTQTQWSTNYILRSDDKKVFRMFEETTDKFLMGAIFFKDVFYISPYEHILETGSRSTPLTSHFFAQLRPEGRSYKLLMSFCENCELNYMRMTRGSSTQHKVLAEIDHFVKLQGNDSVEQRCVEVRLPHIEKDSTSRNCWCPRFRNHNNTRQVLSSKLAQWNSTAQCLVIDFTPGRVNLASSKNIILCCTTEKEIESQFLEFGKHKRRHFTLDYRSPVCPLQAFAIALSMFDWRAK